MAWPTSSTVRLMNVGVVALIVGYVTTRRKTKDGFLPMQRTLSRTVTKLLQIGLNGVVPNVAFFTDVEGNWEYFLRCVERTKCLRIIAHRDDGAVDLALEPGWHLVFGGDSVDRGGLVGGSVRVVRSLLLLKRRHTSRVTLVLGNRDINKMRLTSELAPSELSDDALNRVPGPYWVPEAKRVSPAKYLRSMVAKQLQKAETEVTPAEVRAANTPASRLRWMLKDTMGADGEFERRQAELSMIVNDGTAIGDAEVVASFVESVQPGGFMYEYLHEGVLAARIGDALYMHGGIVGNYHGGATTCLGHVPAYRGGEEHQYADVDSWVAALNAWKDAQLAEWRVQPHWAPHGRDAHPSATAEPQAMGQQAASEHVYEHGQRGGHLLMDYAVPGCGPSVVYSKHLDGKGMPMAMPTPLETALSWQGVHRIVVGHNP